MKTDLVEQGVALILKGLEVDLNDRNFRDTPQRYARAMEELFGCPSKPHCTFDESYTDFILVRDHEIWTLCPHHLLPVRMRVSLAYIPNGHVLGLSKIVRIMHDANAGPMMQERYTYALREQIQKVLPSQKGVCVLVEGQHGCMLIRGVKSHANAITMATSGLFEDHRMLDRFMFLVKGGNHQ